MTILKGLPGALLKELREVLLTTAPLMGNQLADLQLLFAHEDLQSYRFEVPWGSDRNSRANALINFLYNKPYDQPNPLGRFLRVLAEQYEGDPRSGALREAADKLAKHLGEQEEVAFTEALLPVYPDYQTIATMVKEHFQRDLSQVVSEQNGMRAVLYKLVKVAKSEKWLPHLLVTARAVDPGNVQLLLLSQDYGLASTEIPQPELERLVHQHLEFIDPAVWREKQGWVEARVCRFEADSYGLTKAWGTGFLVGPDVVMTNFHVIKELRERPGNTLFCRFDFRVEKGGAIINNGTRLPLADDWLLASSPPSEAESGSNPFSTEPSKDELDFALLRLSRPIGREPIDATAKEGSPMRGWIEVPTEPYHFQNQTPLLIMQHPNEKPLKLALLMRGVIGENANKTRVRYETNTEPGSSGSPCFDLSWQLVALHHLGDPNFPSASFNQGVPISAIRNYLVERELDHLLGG